MQINSNYSNLNRNSATSFKGSARILDGGEYYRKIEDNVKKILDDALPEITKLANKYNVDVTLGSPYSGYVECIVTKNQLPKAKNSPTRKPFDECFEFDPAKNSTDNVVKFVEGAIYEYLGIRRVRIKL